MTVKKTIWLSTTEVYALCNEQNLFNNGSNEEYESMFELVRTINETNVDDKLFELAINLINHTDTRESDPFLKMMFYASFYMI